MKRLITLLLVFSLFLCGCETNGGENGTESTNETADDSLTTETEIVTETESSGRITSTVDAVFGAAFIYVMEGLDYPTYDGGEMTLTLYLDCEDLDVIGVGVIIFIDGIPQPTYSSDSDEYTYLHAFYPEDGEHNIDFTFTPVSGSAGDEVEAWAMVVEYPDYFYSTTVSPTFYDTGGASCVTTKITYNTDAPAATLNENVSAIEVLNFSVTSADCTEKEIEGWSDEDLLENLQMLFYVNDVATTDLEGHNTFVQYEVTNEGTMKLRAEIWGTPYGEYELSFFCDYEPIMIDGENLTTAIQLEVGQKTIVEVELDMSDFDGSCKVFAALTTTNMYEVKDKVNSTLGLFMMTSETYYLTSKEQ